MKRKIINIDEAKCTGCGLCIPECPEGAIQLIDGKARVVSDLYCDGLGACIGHCPEGAITIEEREALPYDELRVMENVVPQGEAVIKAHLRHLESHGEEGYLGQALSYLRDRGMEIQWKDTVATPARGCPSAASIHIKSGKAGSGEKEDDSDFSELRYWPVQLHLIPAMAPHFRKADVLLAADCVAYAMGNFHKKYLKNKTLAIACPKLDSNQEVYAEKLRALIEEAEINTLTVITMEVPCCRGLLMLAKNAAERTSRRIPVKWIEAGVRGDVLREEWIL